MLKYKSHRNAFDIIPRHLSFFLSNLRLKSYQRQFQELIQVGVKLIKMLKIKKSDQKALTNFYYICVNFPLRNSTIFPQFCLNFFDFQFIYVIYLSLPFFFFNTNYYIQKKLPSTLSENLYLILLISCRHFALFLFHSAVTHLRWREVNYSATF